MSDKPNKTEGDETLANWKVAPDLHREIKSRAADEGVKMYELAERAWSVYKSYRTEHRAAAANADQGSGSEAAITPHTDYERRIVSAVILFLRQESDSPQLIGLLETLLKDQLDQVGSKKGNPTKRRA